MPRGERHVNPVRFDVAAGLCGGDQPGGTGPAKRQGRSRGSEQSCCDADSLTVYGVEDVLPAVQILRGALGFHADPLIPELDGSTRAAVDAVSHYGR